MSSVQDMPVEALAARLQEKEQLVAVLTQRLEQAAELLDRQRRTGGDKRRGGGSGGGGGFPPELIESQKQTLEEIGLAVERMEAAQAAETLGRIEAQVAEIRTLLLADVPPVVGRIGSGGGASLPAPREKEKGSTNDLTAESAWAALKARMLDADGKGEQNANSPRKSSQPEMRSEEPASTPVVVKPVEPDPEPEAPIDPPIAVNVETADREALAAAVVARDDYIGYLLRRLRLRESRSLKPVDWASIEAPEELRERLEGLETRLQETLRRAEIESSLERARLGRAAAELEQRSARIEKELRRLGVDDDSRAAHEEEEAEKGPRWMRMLGLGKHDER